MEQHSLVTAHLCCVLPHSPHPRASFDGKHPMRIAKGYSVHFETSLCPLPLINIGVLDTVRSALPGADKADAAC